MEEGMQPRVYLLRGMENDAHSLLLPVAVSFVCHVIFFAMLILSPSHLPQRRFSPTIVNVSLVTLPSLKAEPVSKGGASRGAAKPARQSEKIPLSKTLPKTHVKTERASADTVSVGPQKWKEKTSLKQKTFKPSRVVKRAVKRIEKTAEKSRPRPIAEAIDRLRDKVGEKELINRLKKTGETSGTERVSGIPAGQGTGGKSTPEIFIYQQEIAYHIRNNWVYPEQLADQRTDVEARLMIKIMANGEIREVWFEKRSGNRYLDDSAYKAVMKSSPLPALPKGYQYYTVLLGFTPSGLQ